MKQNSLPEESWNNSNIQVFWGEIAPYDHLVQVYDSEKHFMDTLEGFAGCGLLSDESVIIIATEFHLNELYRRLQNQGFDLSQHIKDHRYIPIEANHALSKFMVNNWPDKHKFNEFILSVLELAKRNDRKVRAFGEMVAILWEQGYNGATVQLENLWHKLHSLDKFSLYCAYPKAGFTQNITESINQICKCHSMVIDGQARPATEIYYRNL